MFLITNICFLRKKILYYNRFGCYAQKKPRDEVYNAQIRQK